MRTFSLLDGLSKPQQIARECVRYGYKACAITDHGSVSGAIPFIKGLTNVCACSHNKSAHSPATQKCSHKGCSCTKYSKYELKPILGNEFYLAKGPTTDHTKENRKLSHLCVLAKNLDGWKALVKATSASNLPENFYYRPRLNREHFKKFAGNLLCFSGHPGSELADCLFNEPGSAYRSKTRDEVLKYLSGSYIDDSIKLIKSYRDIFGPENFFVEIQRIDEENFPAAGVIAEILRKVAKQLKVPCLATADSHYPTHQDAMDQRILLCTALKTTLKSIEYKLANDEDVTLGGFFRSNNYHIPSPAEIGQIHTPEELESSLRIAELCEVYNLSKSPQIPKFNTDNSNEYLRQLCWAGWKSKIQGVIPRSDESKYAERTKHELSVIASANLADYFLLVQDIVNAAKNRGELLGPGRGSAAGCLVSYLINITEVDPIQYNLIFERFYNAGRNSPGRIELPDIDIDVPASKRQNTIDYIKNKFGSDKVGHMMTFGRMQGRNCLTDVLRAHSVGDHNLWKEITKHIPDEAAISDQLQEMKEEEGESSIIKWALEHNSKHLAEYCVLKDNGELDGEFAQYFAQAIRLEGTIRSAGKHAAGIIISGEKLDEVCPVVQDKKGDMICGMDMHALADLGLVKVDILGVSILDKIQESLELINQC